MVDEPVAETVAQRPVPAKMPVELRIGLIAGIILVIISFYIIAQNHRMAARMSATLNAIPSKTSMVGAIRTIPAPAAGIKGSARPEQGVGGNDESASLLSPSKFTAVLSSPKNCSILVNNTPYGVLEGGKTMKIYLDPGDYTIVAAGIGNRPAHYTQRLVVQERNLNHWHKFRIKL
jgi:hypothetical protein